MKTKLTHMLRGKKKRKERKTRYMEWNRGRWRFKYIKGKRTVGKANKVINVEKI